MPTTLIAKQLITESFETGTLDFPTHVAFGTSSTAFTESDTALGNEIQRNAILTTDRQSQTIEWNATLTTAQANGSTLYEVGLFNDDTSGDMYIRQVIYPVSKTSSFEYDTILIMRVK